MDDGAQGEVCEQEERQQAAAADAQAGRPRFLRRGGAGDGGSAGHGSAGNNGNSAKGGKRRK